MKRLTALLALLLLAAPAGASASSSRVTGWGGENPFNCTVQQAGFDPVAPGGDPAADPYCVEFDKTHQNVTQLGIVDFLSKEPARVAAALNKCWYFQSDHWRASVVQDDGSTKLYEWDGHYFFDKARGEGGAWVTNFNVNGHSGDPSTIPGMPPEYAQYMGMGTGGVRVVNDGVEADPQCAAKARAHPEQVYASPAGGGAPGGGTGPSPGDGGSGDDDGAGDGTGSDDDPGAAPCRAPAAGRATARRLGPVTLGMPERRVRAVLGAPAEVRRGFLRYCDDGALLVGETTDRSGDLGSDDDAPAVLVIATRGRFRAGRVGPGTAAPRGWRTVARTGGVRVVARTARSPVLAGVRGGRVRFLAVADRAAIGGGRRGLETLLARALRG